MKLLKTLILALTAVFAMNNFAAAETVVPTTGHGYGTTTSSTVISLADGSTLIRQTTHGLWSETSTEAGFPADKVADCNPTLLLSAEGAMIAFR